MTDPDRTTSLSSPLPRARDIAVPPMSGLLGKARGRTNGGGAHPSSPASQRTNPASRLGGLVPGSVETVIGGRLWAQLLQGHQIKAFGRRPVLPSGQRVTFYKRLETRWR